ncbi:MAG: PIN domain-containing protein [Candidatus Methylacidiphilales bacterium]|nr:PIN domain-containing protein [Candidatus Methylacidiphilales bacterium]
MAGQVFDSYALLAYLRNEPGADTVQAILEKAGGRGSNVMMSEVNYAEVQYITRRKSGEHAWDQVAASLETLPIEFIPTSRDLADTAASFKVENRLSLADAFAAALAKQKKAGLVTGDKKFAALEKQVKIVWIGK